VAWVEASDGVRLYAEAHGEGVPLVFSCAFCTTHENWRSQVQPLVAAGARVILWDFRGHGESQAPEDPAGFHIDQVVEDLGSVLDWAAGGEAGEPAVLAGLSFGGLASLHFALRWPERVRALLLVGSGPGFKNPDAQARWEKQVARTGEILETKGLRAFVSGRAGATTIGRDPELPAARLAAAAIEAQNPSSVAEFGRRVAGPAPCVIDRLKEIQAPALVLVGEQDEAYQRAGDVMAAKLPQAQLARIPAAGHIANIEAEAAFNAHAAAFFQSVAGDLESSRGAIPADSPQPND
jgi:pimeloyl-ACP methyl ester carboxylesterase